MILIYLHLLCIWSSLSSPSCFILCFLYIIFPCSVLSVPGFISTSSALRTFLVWLDVLQDLMLASWARGRFLDDGAGQGPEGGKEIHIFRKCGTAVPSGWTGYSVSTLAPRGWLVFSSDRGIWGSWFGLLSGRLGFPESRLWEGH